MKIIIISIFLIALSAAGVTGSEQESQIFKASIDGGIQKVSILGGSYFFKPNHIIVKVNVPVHLSIQKESGMVPHNIVIKAPEAGIDVEEAMKTKVKTIKFTPTQTGTYKVFCSKKLLFFASHEKKGMEGILEVIE
jgi:plastocyanin domain-containing protein